MSEYRKDDQDQNGTFLGRLVRLFLSHIGAVLLLLPFIFNDVPVNRTSNEFVVYCALFAFLMLQGFYLVSDRVSFAKRTILFLVDLANPKSEWVILLILAFLTDTIVWDLIN